MTSHVTAEQILGPDSDSDSDDDMRAGRNIKRQKLQKITVPKTKINKYYDEEHEPNPGDIDEFEFDKEEEDGKKGKKKSEDKDVWAPVTFSDMMTENIEQWNEEKRVHPTRPRSQDCFACRSAIFTPNPRDPPELYKDTLLLMEMIKKSTMNISTNALIDEIHSYFNLIIRKNMVKYYKQDPGEWYRKDIYNHLFYHMIDPGLEIRHQIDISRIAMRNLTNQFQSKNEDTGEIKTNTKNMDQYIKFGANNVKILKEKPEKNINFNPLSTVTSGNFKVVSSNKTV